MCIFVLLKYNIYTKIHNIMKKIYTILALSFTVLMANATVVTIDVAPGMFTPATINAVCGDTVRWIWTTGNASTTSTTIPNGAASWDSGVNNAGFVFDYVVTVAGDHNYHCVNDPVNMTGTIVVTCSAGIASINNHYFSAAYPNPFSNKLIIETSDVDMITLYNVIGEEIKTVSLPHGQTKTEINVADIREGIYFYRVIKEGIVIETRKIVKN